MYPDLVPRSTEFSDAGPKSGEPDAGREVGKAAPIEVQVANWEVEQYRNNRMGSPTVVLNVLDGWGYVV